MSLPHEQKNRLKTTQRTTKTTELKTKHTVPRHCCCSVTVACNTKIRLLLDRNASSARIHRAHARNFAALSTRTRSIFLENPQQKFFLTIHEVPSIYLSSAYRQPCSLQHVTGVVQFINPRSARSLKSSKGKSTIRSSRDPKRTNTKRAQHVIKQAYIQHTRKGGLHTSSCGNKIAQTACNIIP